MQREKLQGSYSHKREPHMSASRKKTMPRLSYNSVLVILETTVHGISVFPNVSNKIAL